MALLPNFFIIPAVIIAFWLAAVEGIEIPSVNASQEYQSLPDINRIVFDRALNESTNAVINISISSGVTELGSNYFPNVTSHMGIRIENPDQIKNMKCDVFGGEKSLRKKRQSFRDPRRPPGQPEKLSWKDVEIRACVKNGTLLKINIFESGKAPQDSNCSPVGHRHSNLYFNLTINKFAKGWCCGGMADATEFLKTEAKDWNGLWLHLESTGISEFPNDAFKDGPLLLAVNLQRNNLTDTKIIANLPSTLKQLDLSRNVITEIQAHYFSHLRELRVLDLEYNQITILEPYAFKSNENLALLYLNDNRISNLEVGVFTGLPVLRTLNLGSNLLRKISVNVFNLTGLRRLDISNNNITEIESGALKFSYDPDIDGYDQGYYDLDISDNPMPKLQNGALFGLPKISNCQVRMRRTSIKFIEGGVFDEKRN